MPVGPREDQRESVPGRASLAWFLITLAVGALFGGPLNAKFGADWHSLESFLATMMAFALGAVLNWFVAETYRRLHHLPAHTYLRAL